MNHHLNDSAPAEGTTVIPQTDSAAAVHLSDLDHSLSAAAAAANQQQTNISDLFSTNFSNSAKANPNSMSDSIGDSANHSPNQASCSSSRDNTNKPSHFTNSHPITSDQGANLLSIVTSLPTSNSQTHHASSSSSNHQSPASGSDLAEISKNSNLISAVVAPDSNADSNSITINSHPLRTSNTRNGLPSPGASAQPTLTASTQHLQHSSSAAAAASVSAAAASPANNFLSRMQQIIRDVSREPIVANKNAHSACECVAQCMMGAFTCTEATAAAKLLSFPVKNHSKQTPSPMDLIRLLCLKHFTHTFTAWKI